MSAASERHNHITRDIKPRGECPACDAYYDRHVSPVSAASEREELASLVCRLTHTNGGQCDNQHRLLHLAAADAILAHFRQSRADGGDCERCEAQWPATPEQIAGGWSRGWADAMMFAHHAHTDENGRTSANGVLGAGPDCIIVDEDWLNAQLAAIDAARELHPALRPEGNLVTDDTPDYCGGDHGGNPPTHKDCPTIRALEGGE